jgi:hypothetical protein
MLVRRRWLVSVKCSANIICDVVEALIGAAYLHGGFDLGIECARLFGLGLVWEKLPLRVEKILSRVETTNDFPTQMTDVERMLEYDFNRKLLLVEAITHASYQFDNRTVSYERLEFLGDSGASLTRSFVVLRTQIRPRHKSSVRHGGNRLLISCPWQRVQPWSYAFTQVGCR